MKIDILVVWRKIFALVLFLIMPAILIAVFLPASSHAVVGINQQLNFQGRLLTSQGATVPDGFYNVQFKIYQDGDGLTAGDTTGSPVGVLKWTESRLNNNSQGVTVKNGFMSVSLGEVTPFGAGVDWNQGTLWLSVNIGSTNTTCTPFTSCTPDGEMIPMKRLSSTPYSLNSGLLGGLSSAQFLQLAQGVQTDASTNTASIFINKTGTGNLIDLQSTNTDVFVLSGAGDIALGSNANHSLSVSTSAAGVVGRSLTVSGGTGGTGATNLAGGDLLLQGGTAGGTNGTGGNVAINAGAASGTGTAGVINIGTSTASAINIGTVTTGTTNVIIGSSGTATGGTTTVQSKTSITLNTNGITRATWDNANNLYLGNGVTAATPNNFAINGTGSSTTAVTGGALTIQGGNATVGNANGGNLTLTGGTGFGTGVNGIVVIATPTFSTTANDPNCYTGGALVTGTVGGAGASNGCTFALSSVNNSAAILAGFSATSQTAALPDPTLLTAGRVVYITAANTSKDFTLSVNGGGVGNTIAMRQNTTATMIWSGTDWTAAGASSSTTLQSAYDNTLTTAGGAELVLSNTANANGLTIRDNPTTPINGALLEVQTSTAGELFSVNNNTAEYAKDGGGETGGGTSDASDATFPATTWGQAAAGGTVSRTTTTLDVNSQISTGMASIKVVTAATPNQGAVDRLSTTLTQNMNYNVSFAVKLLGTSNSFQDLTVYYSINGTALTTPCTNYSTQTVQVSAWSKINCTFTVPAGATATNSIIIVQNTNVIHTFYIDNLSVSLAANVNYITDGGADDTANFGTNWTAVSTATVAQDTTIGNDRNTSVRVSAPNTASVGVRNKLSITPFGNSTLYRITAYAASSTAFSDFTIRYSPDNGTTFIPCKDYSTQIVSTSTTAFNKITCYITTDNTTVTTPYIYFTQASAPGSTRTFYIDTVSMNLSSSTVPNVQIGGGLAGSPLTLFTVDRGASAPIASNNDALLGSMYYDTTLGKLQCYESDGWGACGSSPDSVITISPEYTNAVLHGTGVGTMTSDLCSATLGINDGSGVPAQPTICGTNETYNFYKWTSPQNASQTYSIYVTYQLPTTFKAFASGQTSLMGRTDNGPTTGTGTVRYSIYKNHAGSALVQCGGNGVTIQVSTGTSASWSTVATTGLNGAADPSACSFAASDSIVFKIDLTANKNANAYVGNLNFIFTNK